MLVDTTDTAGPDTGHDGGSSGLPPLIFAFNVMGHITEQALGKAIPDISGANARIIMLIAHNDSPRRADIPVRYKGLLLHHPLNKQQGY